MAKEFVRKFPTNTAVEVVTPTNLTGLESDPLSLHLDQTTPQNVVNGIPNFVKGIRMSAPTVPDNPSATGVVGQVAWDDTYIYICIALNTWKRTEIVTWAAVSYYLLMEDGNALLQEDGSKLILEN